MSWPEINGFEDMEVQVMADNERMPSLTLNERDILGAPIDGLEALQQSIGNILSTERFTNTIYDHAYGVEFEELYGYDMEFSRVDVERRILEALFEDDRILDIEDFKTRVEGSVLNVSFTVVSSLGEFEQEVMLDGGGN